MKDLDDIRGTMAAIGRRARAASTTLAFAEAAAKSRALRTAADAVRDHQVTILAANAADVDAGRECGLSAAMLDRLTLNPDRIATIAASLCEIAEQPELVGEVMAEWDRPSGLHIKRVRTPIGVVGVIYESRPNVTADAGALCLKSGNAVILRGGSESFGSSSAIHRAMRQGLVAAGLPEDAIQFVPTRNRAAVSEMLTMTDWIDVIVPRGGKSLVELVQREARVPVFAHLEGIVHLYIDAAADSDKAMRVTLNSKTRRPGICGAAECLLIHKDVANTLGRELVTALLKNGVEVRADATLSTVPGTVAAEDADWGREFLDMTIAARTVGSIDEAVLHIRTHGSHHTDGIVTEDAAAAAYFFERLDSAILIHNASTQFADGGEFGMGAEIGIATGKLHARGPVGAEQLTSFKYLVTGNGNVRP